jgi:hypothetical protein
MTTNLARPDTIDSSRLRRLRQDDPGIRILDVRTGGEFETVHIPGSYNVPLDTLREHVSYLAGLSIPSSWSASPAAGPVRPTKACRPPARARSTSWREG